jgi:PhoH-like ATPase
MLQRMQPRASGTVYVPDTSSLVENPESLDRLLSDGNVVVLLHQVIEELGRLQASRHKSDGVADFELTDSGGLLVWEPHGGPLSPYLEGSGDNLIVAGAQRIAELARKGGGGMDYRVVVISEDNNVLLKCDAVGLAAENLRYGKVDVERPELLQEGHVEVGVDAGVIERFFASGEPLARTIAFEHLPTEVVRRLGWNTSVILTHDSRSFLLRSNPEAGRLEDLRFGHYWDRKREVYRPKPVLGLTPLDAMQVFALEYLLDPTVQLVVLDGPAGSGKTRLMVAAALHLLVGPVRRGPRPPSLYENGLVLLRPEHPSSAYDMGYLPGDYETKVSHWLEPLFQHMRSLGAQNEHDFVADLERREQLQMLSTAMLRGLDIERSIVLVDELQNGDRHLAKTLMSRFCETSKVVLAGSLDAVQIDNPYVDWRSNALSRIKQAFRGFGPFVAQIGLAHNYRGPISKKADEL